MHSYYYIDVSLVFEDDAGVEVSKEFFKENIVQALYQLFGEAGSSIEVTLLKYDQATKRAVLRVPTPYYIKLRASLTLRSTFFVSGYNCAYQIHKVSPLLLALQGDSRGYKH